MARPVEFVVTHPLNRRHAVGPDIRRMARSLMDDARSRTPNAPPATGEMAGAWAVEPGPGDPATFWVVNPVKHARYVEYGTRGRPPAAPLGRAMAATGLPRWPKRRSL